MSKKSVVVIGSLNIDFVTRTSRVPEAGETLTAISSETGYGGKGANQCVACARLSGEGVSVSMVGNVGDDQFGADYLAALKKEGIDASGVRRVPGQKTGVTNIIVEVNSGENRILFVPNANNAFDAELNQSWELVPPACDLVVFQLEIPMPIVLHNLHQARESGKHTILNPAPAALLPDFAYQDIDTLIMNETESAILAGPDKVSTDDDMALLSLAKRFLSWGVKESVIITLGARGLVYATASGTTGSIPAQKVEVVDTTAAGDTFVGAYAVQRARHTGSSFNYAQALEFASLAASKTVSRSGAVDAIPRLAEL